MKSAKKKRKKKRTGLIIFLVLLFLLAITGLAVSHYLYQRANSGLFFKETSLNGYDVSEKSAKEVLSMMVKDFSAPVTTVTEQGETVLTLSLKDMGYEVDEVKLLSQIKDCMTQQNLSLITSLFQGNNYEITVPFNFDQDTFDNAVSSEKFSVPRVKSVDATLEYDDKNQQYYIQPEVYGNEMDDADVRVIVKDEVDQLVVGDRPGQDLTVQIPEALYFTPSITADDQDMNRKMNAWNQYCKAKITYTFGSEEKTVDWEEIRNWIVMDGDEAYISEEDMYNFVYALAEETDTYHYDRTFYTTSGRSIYFDGSDYGFAIDKDHEVEQLLADIQSNTAVKREPVYAVRGFSRNGRDDFNGFYVEVDLTAQHLYLYYEGSMVFDTPVVSGLPRNGRETASGVFTIPYKASPFRLTGGGAGGWDVDVTYWMPFHDGQGLHDASWRSNFGGNIYQTNGSHGCVNLPTYAAATIYSYIDSNYPIVLYK